MRTLKESRVRHTALTLSKHSRSRQNPRILCHSLSSAINPLQPRSKSAHDLALSCSLSDIRCLSHWSYSNLIPRWFVHCLPSRHSLLFFHPRLPTHAACQSFSRGNLGTHGLTKTARTNTYNNAHRRLFRRESRSIACQTGSEKLIPTRFCA